MRGKGTLCSEVLACKCGTTGSIYCNTRKISGFTNPPGLIAQQSSELWVAKLGGGVRRCLLMLSVPVCKLCQLEGLISLHDQSR